MTFDGVAGSTVWSEKNWAFLTTLWTVIFWNWQVISIKIRVVPLTKDKIWNIVDLEGTHCQVTSETKQGDKIAFPRLLRIQ